MAHIIPVFRVFILSAYDIALCIEKNKDFQCASTCAIKILMILHFIKIAMLFSFFFGSDWFD